jgi:hypothetical protein
MSVACPIRSSACASIALGFAEHVCRPFLLNSQNCDGGWGFHPDSDSAVEPTCWALAALGVDQLLQRQEPVQRGLKWLCEAQLSDGSWPAFPAQQVGCWTTSTACLALIACNYAPKAVARGRQWLCKTWPAERTVWWRFSGKFLRRNPVVRQDSSLRGWSWTKGTASWVEPTSAALLALRSFFLEAPMRDAARRQSLGERMLYDRMCPGGGWNSGNPLVYGVAGDPRIGPTAWALLALRQYPSRRENQISLQWLHDSYGEIRGPVSLSLAHICLAAYGKAMPPIGPALDEMFSTNQFLGNVASVAWAMIASEGSASWLCQTPGNGSPQ